MNQGQRNRKYLEYFNDQINHFGDIVQKEISINYEKLRDAMNQTPDRFYKIQRASLSKFEKTITYNKKLKKFDYTAFSPLIKYSSKKLDLLLIRNPSLERFFYTTNNEDLR